MNEIDWLSFTVHVIVAVPASPAYPALLVGPPRPPRPGVVFVEHGEVVRPHAVL